MATSGRHSKFFDVDDVRVRTFMLAVLHASMMA
jgi:hypothetical protein